MTTRRRRRECRAHGAKTCPGSQLVVAPGGRQQRRRGGEDLWFAEETQGIRNEETEHDRERQAVGESIIQGLKEAIAWPEGKNDRVRVTMVDVPAVDVRKVRPKMGLSQPQLATKFGFPPATLRNWEQGRSHPDTPTRVLLAVIARRPEAVEEVLRKAKRSAWPPAATLSQ